MSAVILQDFDPERDEKRVDNSLFTWFKKYEYVLHLNHIKGFDTPYIKCKVMFPLEPDDFIKNIIHFHAEQSKMSLDELKEEIDIYISEGGRITCSCPEMNQLIYLITYMDRFSSERYGEPATLKFFDGNEEHYTLIEKIGFRLRTSLAYFLTHINYKNIFFEIERIKQD